MGEWVMLLCRTWGVTACFDEYENYVIHMQLLDLNPVERLWDILEWHVSALHYHHQNIKLGNIFWTVAFIPSEEFSYLYNLWQRALKLFWRPVVAQHIPVTLCVGFYFYLSPFFTFLVLKVNMLPLYLLGPPWLDSRSNYIAQSLLKEKYSTRYRLALVFNIQTVFPAVLNTSCVKWNRKPEWNKANTSTKYLIVSIQCVRSQHSGRTNSWEFEDHLKHYFTPKHSWVHLDNCWKPYRFSKCPFCKFKLSEALSLFNHWREAWYLQCWLYHKRNFIVAAHHCRPYHFL